MTRATTLPENWKTLADHCGGVRQLADALGVSATTLGRWAHGKQPISGSGALLLARIKAEIASKPSK